MVLTIKGNFYTNLLSLDRETGECEIENKNVEALENKNVEALNLVDKATTKLTNRNKFEGKSKDFTVLEAVTKLTFEYKVTDDQSTLLTKVFCTLL